jgi:hypothetical protein
MPSVPHYEKLPMNRTPTGVNLSPLRRRPCVVRPSGGLRLAG